jgi:predicted GIY-YIG superfamily endonuclease
VNYPRVIERTFAGCERMDFHKSTEGVGPMHVGLGNPAPGRLPLALPRSTMSMTLPPRDVDTGVPHETPTSVYRYYDKYDLLIYVGITNRGIQRNREHNTGKAWWPYVVRQEVEHFPTRAQALAREKLLIGKHRPPFNHQHNPDHGPLRDAYAAFMAQSEAGSCRELFKQLDRRLPLVPIPRDDERYLLFVSNPVHGGLASKIGRPDKLIVHAQPSGFRVGRLVDVEQRGPVIIIRVRLDGSHEPDVIDGAHLRLGMPVQKPTAYCIRSMGVTATMIRKER